MQTQAFVITAVVVKVLVVVSVFVLVVVVVVNIVVTVSVVEASTPSTQNTSGVACLDREFDGTQLRESLDTSFGTAFLRPAFVVDGIFFLSIDRRRFLNASA